MSLRIRGNGTSFTVLLSKSVTLPLLSLSHPFFCIPWSLLFPFMPAFLTVLFSCQGNKSKALHFFLSLFHILSLCFFLTVQSSVDPLVCAHTPPWPERQMMSLPVDPKASVLVAALAHALGGSGPVRRACFLLFVELFSHPGCVKDFFSPVSWQIKVWSVGAALLTCLHNWRQINQCSWLPLQLEFLFYFIFIFFALTLLWHLKWMITMTVQGWSNRKKHNILNVCVFCACVVPVVLQNDNDFSSK